MSARRRAKVVPLPPPPFDPSAATEAEIELEDLAGVIWLIRCGIDTNGDLEELGAALSHVERTLRRLSDQVGDNERRRRGRA